MGVQQQQLFRPVHLQLNIVSVGLIMPERIKKLTTLVHCRYLFGPKWSRLATSQEVGTNSVATVT